MSRGELLAWVQEQARNYDHSHDEISRFREISSALEELAAMKLAAASAETREPKPYEPWGPMTTDPR
jgi:hypothetical protein